MKYIKNIKLIMLGGLLLEVGIGFAYGKDWAERGQNIVASLEWFDRIPVSKLIEAAQKGNSEDLKNALNSLETNINEQDKYNTTAVMYAARSGRKDIVKLLIDKGADPHIITWNDKTALREAVKEGHKEITKLLLDINSKFRQRSMDCALVEGAQKGHKDIVNVLLDNGANPNSTAISNNPSSLPMDITALEEAVIEGHKDIVKLLLDRGANPHIRSMGSTSVLQIAKNKGHKEIIQLIDKAIKEKF